MLEPDRSIIYFSKVGSTLKLKPTEPIQHRSFAVTHSFFRAGGSGGGAAALVVEIRNDLKDRTDLGNLHFLSTLPSGLRVLLSASPVVNGQWLLTRQ